MIHWREERTELPVSSLDSLRARLRAADARRAIDLAGDGMRVVVAAKARETVARHVADRRDEQGGLLLGALFAADGRADSIAAVEVRAAIPATDFSSSGVSLRMETGVWDRARESLALGEVVVGWYHSHPSLGAFFSGTDQRTQAAFFNHPFSLGWVIDPFRREEAWFAGARSEALPIERVIFLAA